METILNETKYIRGAFYKETKWLGLIAVLLIFFHVSTYRNKLTSTFNRRYMLNQSWNKVNFSQLFELIIYGLIFCRLALSLSLSLTSQLPKYYVKTSAPPLHLPSSSRINYRLLKWTTLFVYHSTKKFLLV